jgi:hypothetical protein
MMISMNMYRVNLFSPPLLQTIQKDDPGISKHQKSLTICNMNNRTDTATRRGGLSLNVACS